MIIKHRNCTKCQSNKLVKNGKTKSGKQKFKCLECKSYGTLDSSWKTQEEKEEILKVYKERSSLRGIQRIYGVAPKTILSWIKKKSILE